MTDTAIPLHGVAQDQLLDASGTRVTGTRKRRSDSPPPVNRCGGCNTTWTALSPAHCAGCHETFTSASGFTAHRKGGVCHDPADIGLVLHVRKTWTGWALPGSYDHSEHR